MPLLTPQDLHFADLIRAISFANPFMQVRVDLEREALGDEYVEIGSAKAFLTGEGPNPNTPPLLLRAEKLLAWLQEKASKANATHRDRQAAGDLALFILYHRHVSDLYDLASATAPHTKNSGDLKKLKMAGYRQFETDTEALLMLDGERLRPGEEPQHLFALFFQMARAFNNIFANFIGQSSAAIALRASIWQSIFTHDLARYWRELQKKLHHPSPDAAITTLTSDIPTLITGPSGSGKELVAQAIGRSGFVPFDARTSSFEIDHAALFLPIHLAALSPSLIESELFGHRRGAFTGALEDRASFLETCAPYGAVFLDEIAEIDGTLQVKLLRVLQTREFSRLGDAMPRHFSGRLISATHRDLSQEIDAGRFREDLFYRLHADHVETPPLRQLLQGQSGELLHLLRYIGERLLPSTDEQDQDGQAFAAELGNWIEKNLKLDYPWPGNFRELEQCARAFLIRGHYEPSRPLTQTGRNWLDQARASQLSADDLLNAYCSQVYGEVGSYEGAARKLGLDRRTVRARTQN